MALRAVLFDMDGVLVRSTEVWFRAVEAAGVRFRGRAITWAEFEPTFGQGTAADIPFFGLRCTVAELDAFYTTEFVRHLDAMWVNPEAAPALEALEAQGVSRALVTNTTGPLARAILDRAGLTSWFDFLGTSDLVPLAKPAPDVVLLACARLGISPAEAVMVGDTRFDRQAAQAAGVRFAGYGGIEGDVTLRALTELPSLA